MWYGGDVKGEHCTLDYLPGGQAGLIANCAATSYMVISRSVTVWLYSNWGPA